MKKTRLFFTALAAISFLFQACTSTTSSDNLDDISDDEFEKLPVESQELIYTNLLIHLFYVNADKELQNYSYYENKGAENGYTTRDFEFPDVSYMYGTLSDNFTNYFSPKNAETILRLLTYSEEEVGIGAEVSEVTVQDCGTGENCEESTVLVFKRVYPNGPAATAGIQKGDTLISLDGAIISKESAFEKLSSGTPGTSIPIVVKRGTEESSYTVLLDYYLSPTVFVDTYDSIPVITITEFTDTTYLNTGTYGEFVEALKETEGAASTVIDLRGNPGGSVDQCLDMTSEFLRMNDTITTIITHDYNEEIDDRIIDSATYIVSEDGLGADRYYVFLADSNSASCAEIMLMGVVSTTKSPVVGQITYGKGIGQSYMQTIAGGITGITSMKILDKNMNSYHRYGIAPDYAEDDPEMALQKALELARERSAVRTMAYGSFDTGHFTLAKKQSEKTLDHGAFKFIRQPINFKSGSAPTK